MLGVASLLVTLTAFVITIWQLVKTASATQAAADAVEAIRSRVATYDLVFELSRSQGAVREAQRHLRNSAWSDVVASFEVAREAVTRLAELPSSLQDSDVRSLREIVEELGSVAVRIDAGIQKGEVKIDAAKALKQTAIHLQALTRIGVSIQRAVQ